MSTFSEKLKYSSELNKSLLCVGLDPDPSSAAISDMLQFNKAIINATKDIVCAYKPNLAFFDALGTDGLIVLKATIEHIRDVAPNVVVIGDAKRGDIASTNKVHAKAMFDFLGFDAITVNAYAGLQALAPFVEYADRGIFIWCRSSNNDIGVQDVKVMSGNGQISMFLWLANRISDWDRYGNVGIIAGATYPGDIALIRKICPEMPFLVPGVGAQEGELKRAVLSGMDRFGRNIIMSSSRGVLYASSSRSDYSELARSKAIEIRNNINSILEDEGKNWAKT